MRCKLHPLDSGVGVCAFCLQRRLLELQSSQHVQQLEQEQPRPPLDFPPSVCAFVQHRRSVAGGGGGRDSSSSSSPLHSNYSRLFYSTPQPATGGGIISSSSPFHSHPNSRLFYGTPQPSTGGGGGKNNKKKTTTTTKKKNRPFSFFSALFKLGSNGPRLHPRDSAADPPNPPSSSSWWFSSWKGGRKNGARSEDAGRSTCRVGRVECRGMSPGNSDDEEPYDSSPENRIPAPTPMRRNPNRHLNGTGRSGISGFGVCLSPLVRPSPQRRSQVVAGEIGFSGEMRSDAFDGTHYHRGRRPRPGSGGAVLAVNRSRKLCDIGRFQ